MNMKFTIVVLVLFATGIGMPKIVLAKSASVSDDVSADAGGDKDAGGNMSAGEEMSGKGTMGAGGDMDADGSIGAGVNMSAEGNMGAGGSLSAGGSAQGNIDIGGCGQGGISGDASVNGQAGGDLSGGAQGGIQGDASLNGCGCRPQGGIRASGNANVDAGGQGGRLAYGDASLNWPENGCGSPPETTTTQAGFTYNIQVEKTYSVCYSNNVVYTRGYFTSGNVAEKEILKYYQQVDIDHPFYIDGSLKKGNKDIYTIDRYSPINACDKYKDGTWEHVLAKTCLIALASSDECPIEPGDHIVYKAFTVQTTFEDMVDCGDYNIHVYLDNSLRQWSFELKFVFTIAKNCNS